MLFDAGAIRFVISRRPLAAPGLRLLEHSPRDARQPWPVHLYEYERALPRAYLAYRSVPVSGLSELPLRLGDGFDARRATVVEGREARLDGPATIEAVERTSESPERLRFEIAPVRPAVLVVTDSWYPGWRAWVDGVESPILRVNGLFRGVPVGAGAQRVEMRFEPWTFRAGAALSLVAAAAVTALTVVAGVRRHTPPE